MERSADWLYQAQGDLAHAQHDLEAGFFDWACFSAQQAAEKATKAVLQRLGVEVWGHAVFGFRIANFGFGGRDIRNPQSEIRNSKSEIGGTCGAHRPVL